MSNNTSLEIHPDFKSRVKVTYEIEYTEKDEDIDINFSNLKKIQCNGLEEAIEWMFRLRQRDKFNIQIYTLTEIDGQWITQDRSSSGLEYYKGNAIEKKQSEQITKLEENIQLLEKEINQHNSFLEKYHAQEEFKKYKKENNIYTYYFRLRPPMPGAQPKEGLLSTSDNKIYLNNREYWGAASYNRELTKTELFDYDLDKAI